MIYVRVDLQPRSKLAIATKAGVHCLRMANIDAYQIVLNMENHTNVKKMVAAVASVVAVLSQLHPISSDGRRNKSGNGGVKVSRCLISTTAQGLVRQSKYFHKIGRVSS